MPNNILIKKSSVAARVPTTADLDYGELALNYADGAVYYKTSGNVIARLNPSETDTLATVTTRGATTSNAVTIGGLTVNGNSSITGNVGIGTASPAAKLGLTTPSASAQQIIMTNGQDNASDYQEIKFQYSQSNAAVATAMRSIRAVTANYGAHLAFLTENIAGTFAERMRIDSQGNVGIGTTPTAKLHVIGNSILQVGTNDTGYVYNQITTSALSGGGLFGVEGSTPGSLIAGTLAYATVLSSSSSNTHLQLGTSGTVRMTVLSSGYVGVGTTSPGARLDIAQSTAGVAGLRVYNSHATEPYGLLVDNTVLTTGETYYVADFRSGGTSRLRINSSGNVGIGTTTPGQLFDIWSGGSSKFWVRSDGVVTVTGEYRAGPMTIGQGGLRYSGSNGTRLIIGYANSGNAPSEGGQIDLMNRGDGVADSASAIIFRSGNVTGEQPEVARITKTGNVGIGTTSPGYSLEISKAASSGAQLTLTNPTISNGTAEGGTGQDIGALNFVSGDTSTSQGSVIRAQIKGLPGEIAYGTGAELTFSTWPTYAGPGASLLERMRITNIGNVGIGTTTPTYALHVNDTASPYNAFSAGMLGTEMIKVNANGISLEPYSTGNGSDGIYVKAYDSTWNLRTVIQVINQSAAVSPHLVLQPTGGNVGIGTATPSQALHVSGSARITGAVYDSSNSAGTNGQVLTSTVTGTTWSSSGAGVGGTGTAGKIVKWSSVSVLADSVITESSGNIGIDTAPSQKLDVNGNIGWGTDHVLAYATLTTTATTANQIIASISATTYRTCKFIIQAVDATAGKYQSQEIMAIHNGSAVAHTEYTAITVGAAVATFDVDISGSTVRLLCTPLSVNSTVFKISMQLIKV